MRLRYGENFAGTTQAIALWRDASSSTACTSSFHPAGHVLGSAQIKVECERPAHRRLRRLQGRGRSRPARRSSRCPATCSSPRRRSACRCSAITMPQGEIAKLLRSVALFPERAHLVGAYSLGKAQRVIAMLRAAGYDKPIYLHGAMEKITATTRAAASISVRSNWCAAPRKRSSPAPSRICPPSAMGDLWSRRFPDPVAAFASGWMRVRARARQRGVDAAAGDLRPRRLGRARPPPSPPPARRRSGSRTGRKTRWCTGARSRGLKARPLDIVGYGDEEEARQSGAGRRRQT